MMEDSYLKNLVKSYKRGYDDAVTDYKNIGKNTIILPEDMEYCCDHPLRQFTLHDCLGDMFVDIECLNCTAHLTRCNNILMAIATWNKLVYKKRLGNE